jgi:hypothetical protein
MRKLGTLEVWIDEDSTKSSFTKRDNVTGDYKIVLNPKGDKERSGEDNTPAVLAHELGHFVGRILETPAAMNSGRYHSSANDTLVAEKEAWKFADEIVPGISESTIAKKAIGNYSNIAKNAGHMPMGLLMDLGFIR